MDEKTKQYRTKHKKCKWCKYYKWYSYAECHYCTCYGKCKLKDKIINFNDIPRLCKWYELKETKDNEISINQSNE